ncbi:fungal-specific transcription factor domain protein [Aspergillus coremiiformis]|uniref:Fungal-specific transcription factor domain protein n=1 Tax=Aspergillus coremiiformis TaxID=138285 RepID=A0A5N6ZFV7_9EURO|nr:fungal-specific transcription factor domain protein [Aspergillus coremiiformis]
MDVDNGWDTDTTAPHACLSCKRNKRRCDKSLPSCSLCLKAGRLCDYSDASQFSQTDEIRNLQSRIQVLEARVLGSSGTSSTTASTIGVRSGSNPPADQSHSSELSIQAYYLDSDLWSSFSPLGHGTHVPVSEDVSTALGRQDDIENIISRYFGTVHIWMPIISKIRLGRLIQQTQQAVKADVALLLLCMKLVCEVPHAQRTGSSELYRIAKRFSHELELSGLFTLRTVQASVLLSVYEMGHGVFPAAFTTIGNSSRHGVALGLHNSLASQLIGKPRGWVDWEERQRVWWMIVILDRYITVGSDHRPLCTEDPSKDTLLPADDGAWDSGEMMTPERVSLSSRSTNPVSPFARLAQASNLLGRVIRHCNETTLELSYVLEDFDTLCQTISSLLDLLSIDNRNPSMEIHLAIGICFSAVFRLADHHSCDMFNEEGQYLELDAAPRVHECTRRSLQMTKDTCERVVSLVQDIGKRLTQSALENASPLMLQCIYSSASNLSWMALETNNVQYTAGKLICEEILRAMNSRWKVAGVYLELLRFGDMVQDERN